MFRTINAFNRFRLFYFSLNNARRIAEEMYLELVWYVMLTIDPSFTKQIISTPYATSVFVPHWQMENLCMPHSITVQ